MLGEDVGIAPLLELLGSVVASGVFPPKDGVRSPEFLQACRRSSELRSAHLALLDGMTARLAKTARHDQSATRLRPDIDPEAVGALLVLLEAGVEVMSDLGWTYDAAGVATTVSRLLAPV
jgi:hypothetical protein